MTTADILLDPFIDRRKLAHNTAVASGVIRLMLEATADVMASKYAFTQAQTDGLKLDIIKEYKRRLNEKSQEITSQ